jgi:hypothetical protein
MSDFKPGRENESRVDIVLDPEMDRATGDTPAESAKGGACKVAVTNFIK